MIRPDDPFKRITPPLNLPQASPAGKAQGADPVTPPQTPSAESAAGGEAAVQGSDPVDLDTVDQDNARTYDLEKTISFDQTGAAKRTEAVDGPALNERQAMGLAFGRAAQQLHHQGLSPAIESLRGELSPDVSQEALQEALFEAFLWGGSQQA
ncbi:MAG: hypothetical protein CVV27_00950 [Candidatus Melainabacteria bacterium HGW-Melainabacteria-1]|nr:MAG: hypothetical protein CVV27_00950 [Candidatus Melainabacteria bacterium HGW-Melainabacteria-1]